MREVYVKKSCGFSWPQTLNEAVVRMRLLQTLGVLVRTGCQVSICPPIMLCVGQDTWLCLKGFIKGDPMLRVQEAISWGYH